MKIDCDIILTIAGPDKSTVFGKKPDKLRESSSTIKVALIIQVLQKMMASHAGLDDKLLRLPKHASIGSGIINWTELKSISLSYLLYTTLVYSDCVATNILLDYIGGQQELSAWLKDRGFRTKLHMPYLQFTEIETNMPKVGSTTSNEMLALYKMLDHGPWPSEMQKLLDYCTSHINSSWFEKSLLPKMLPQLHHKTGSMINSGPWGETVYNAVGVFEHENTEYYFCLLSRGYLNKTCQVTEEELKTHVTNFFKQSVFEFANL